jgi:hypothetical protein
LGRFRDALDKIQGRWPFIASPGLARVLKLTQIIIRPVQPVLVVETLLNVQRIVYGSLRLECAFGILPPQSLFQFKNLLIFVAFGLFYHGLGNLYSHHLL